ncbi:MAG: GTP 3',8-cyclase MoaA [Candidatus Thermoplasmatota archaeon]|nr:GTP 3',8-cyclase MoaA [Euryarchaeota archaeon]MBU4032445.1 GTP 3',8-cyclase MoaA [Candidatus Thermoplasmatota archaeon]MBU4144475.1 GTP 3',8-cyclase MoaA [Candidatus Thermoplasmatota archaeon]MBU4592293.1 GTP 3',8-cyclase MoaA [Candidatus Thermoplasmatota archaeon]
MMHDPFGRPVKSLRFSLTARCDLLCSYCHKEGQRASESEMTTAEIERIIEIAAMTGIASVKFTGGEPLLREDILDIVKLTNERIHDVSITTNGTKLAGLAAPLKFAGLTRVNVSLDTFNRARYNELTGIDKIDDVIQGIRAAVTAQLLPVKVNIVALQETTVDDILLTMRGVWGLGAVPQIIQPIGNGAGSSTFDPVEEIIKRTALRKIEREMHCRSRYFLPDDEGIEREVELVRPMHNTRFCANCTRLRITSDGHLKPCLMHNDGLVDIIDPIRMGASDDELLLLFTKAVNMRRPYWT